MSRSKVHLAHRRDRAACGARITTARLTDQPGEVDCYLCVRTVAMADAEARLALDKRERRSGHSPRKAGRQ